MALAPRRADASDSRGARSARPTRSRKARRSSGTATIGSKGIEEPVEIFELGARDASPFSPPADADKAYRVVRAGDMWRPVREVRHNLPAERDAFVGRAAELRALAARLDAGARLVTVLGPGGTGKTRFVRRYGWTWLGDWPGGVYFCDLSEARSLDGIYFAVALGARRPARPRTIPRVQLGHAIAGRGRCLVILDNFEQVVEHAAATVGRWLDRAPDAAFVVTSRERLHVPRRGGLSGRAAAARRRTRSSSSRRAPVRSARTSSLSDGNRAAVAEVVRLLDGLPLAIELAAARVRVLSPAQLVERMRDRFTLLAGARGAAARQATLRAAIDWSWELLTPWEQGALRAVLGVRRRFHARSGRGGARPVAPGREAPPAMDVVQALADKSLLRTWVPATQAPLRHRRAVLRHVPEHSRVRGGEARRRAGAARDRRRRTRHGRVLRARSARDEAIEALSRHGGVRRRRALALELDNLVAACRRAVARGDGAMAAAACPARRGEVHRAHGPVHARHRARGASARRRRAGSHVARARALAAQRHAACAARVESRKRRRRSRRRSSLCTARWATGDAKRIVLRHARQPAPRPGTASTTRGRVHRSGARASAASSANRRLEGHASGNLGIIHASRGALRRRGPTSSRRSRSIARSATVTSRASRPAISAEVCRESGKSDEARRALPERARDRSRGRQSARRRHRHDQPRTCSTSTSTVTTKPTRISTASLSIAREVGDPSFEGIRPRAPRRSIAQRGTGSTRPSPDASGTRHPSHGRQPPAGRHCARNARRAHGQTRTISRRHAPRSRRARRCCARSARRRHTVGLLCDWADAEATRGDREGGRQARSRGSGAASRPACPDSEISRRVESPRAPRSCRRRASSIP